MKRIAIFASGSGSNAEHIGQYFADRPGAEVSLILTNNPTAGVIARARRLHIPVVVFDKKTFVDSHRITDLLQRQQIDLIVLAGFLMLVPAELIRAFPRRIINIHPALLPKYGGPGMYGAHVHEAVAVAGEVESGITIHYVDERYDEGEIIYQSTCALEAGDDPVEIARKVLQLEHAHFPRVVGEVVGGLEKAG